MADAQKAYGSYRADRIATSELLICKKAKEMVDQGMLGDLMMVEGCLGRNDPTGAWEYPPPTDLSPQNLDWDTWQGTVPKDLSVRRSLRAGAAGRNTEPALRVIFLSILSAA